jgi:hypothetical protein
VNLVEVAGGGTALFFIVALIVVLGIVGTMGSLAITRHYTN